MRDSDRAAFRVVIPARYQSTRLPGKPLLSLAGKTLIEHVYQRACESDALEVVIATDDARIFAAAQDFGADVCMTSTTHRTGTDRLAEVIQQRAWPDDAIIVNLQGDEPLMPSLLLNQVAANLAQHSDAGIATLCIPITRPEDLFATAVVKVLMDKNGYALYFSRAPIPYHRTAFAANQQAALAPDITHFHHLGLYAYKAEVLRAYPKLAASPAEQAEALEQLRALWHGIRIHVQQAQQIPIFGGVDTEQDFARISEIFARS